MENDPQFNDDPSAMPLPPIATPPENKYSVFIGPFGLRAGWSLLIYFLILAALIFSVHQVIKHVQASHHHAAAASVPSAKTATPIKSKSTPEAPAHIVPMIVSEGIFFAVIFLLSWLMAFIERRRVAVFGLGGHHPLSRFLFGAFWGLLALSLLVGLMYTFHVLVFDARLLHGIAILGWGATLLFAFFLVGMLEEYLFRGYVQFTLTRGFAGLGRLISPSHARGFAFWIAAVITSGLFLFAHTHNAGEDKLGLASVFLAGIVFVVALWRTGSLWWAIGFHMAWDWAQSFLYGVPDSGGLMQGRLFATHAVGNPMLSGGTVGPEGSVLLFPVLVLILIVLFFTHPTPQPPLELPPTKSHPPQEEVLQPIA